MRIAVRISMTFAFLLAALAVCAAQAQDTPKDAPKVPPAKLQPITVTGELIRVMAIGAETTGWAIQLDSQMEIDTKPVHSIEIMYENVENLEKWEHKRVVAKGTLDHLKGVESGDRPVLRVTKLKPTKDKSKS